MSLFRLARFALFASLCAGLSAFAGAALAQRSSDGLRPIVKCVESGHLRTREVARLPERVTSRSVTTAAGEASVSLADGYRLILDTPNGVPFVNLKIERSQMAAFERDRTAIRAQMKKFSQERTPGAMPLAESSRDGVEILELHQPSLDKGGPLSLYSLFVPRASIVATAYV